MSFSILHRWLQRLTLSALVLSAAPGGAQTGPDVKPLSALPYTPSLEPAFMDRSVNPCSDLYQYACGGWIKKNPIPADQSRWSVYGKLANETQQFLWGILQEASAQSSGASSVQRMIGDYFAACMNEETIEKLGAAPIKADLAAIEALASKAQLPRWLGQAHLYGSAFFGFGAEQDLNQPSQVITWATAGGLGLPDRDYYVKEDSKSVEIRQRYVAHVAAMLKLSGDAKAELSAAHVMRIETALAKASLTLVEKRDPHQIDHPMTLEALGALTPSFDWKLYLKSMTDSGNQGAAHPLAALQSLHSLNVSEPGFFTGLDKLLKQESLPAIKAYLRWHVVNDSALTLSKAFVQEHFNFYSAYLRGAKEMRPRWKRCVAMVDRDLGEALGQVFVEKSFSAATKTQVQKMIGHIEQVMARRIQKLDWMSAATQKQALAKLTQMRNKIGYPSKFRDYSSIAISRSDFAGNVKRSGLFETHRQLATIGKPVDRAQWKMTPPTVNAYYEPMLNEMNFPAAILLPPLYDPKMDDAPNYGNTGSTIGHELIHGFDDEGRQFDASGQLKEWWTPADAKAFESRVSCIADQYATYTVIDDIKINSRLTLGEDVADLGGLILAWEAWKEATRGQKLVNKEGLTPEQRFFVGFAQWDCSQQRDEDKRLTAATDPHSPALYRINGVVANMPEFAQAFSCPQSAPLVRSSEKRCKVW